MASDAAVSRVLAFLSELFPTRDVSPATLDAWALVFEQWTDDELMECAVRAAKETGRTFFPTCGEIAAKRRAMVMDKAAVLRKIEKLGTYNPHQGWIYPDVRTVRESLGDAIADAYAAAGTTACFADAARDGSTVTRDIAQRAFAQHLEATVAREPDALLPPVRQTHLLTGARE